MTSKIKYCGDPQEIVLELRDKIEEAIALAEEYGGQYVLEHLNEALSCVQEESL
ncbi:MAG: hypothetical protein ISN29_05300 [Gammaproteobacteria bacterium AqS3]|nr:hypothetical protein [Gammaproteobacteria bacterium AqS3]